MIIGHIVISKEQGGPISIGYRSVVTVRPFKGSIEVSLMNGMTYQLQMHMEEFAEMHLAAMEEEKSFYKLQGRVPMKWELPVLNNDQA